MATKILKDIEFKLIPEGAHVVRVREVDDSKFEEQKRLVVTVEDIDGATARSNFCFVRETGEANAIAEAVYAKMCRILIKNQIIEAVDYDDLPGKFALVQVEHSTGTKGGVFANVKRWIDYADAFTTEKPQFSSPNPVKTKEDILAELKARVDARKMAVIPDEPGIDIFLPVQDDKGGSVK